MTNMAKHTTKPYNIMIKGLVFQGKQACEG